MHKLYCTSRSLILSLVIVFIVSMTGSCGVGNPLEPSGGEKLLGLLVLGSVFQNTTQSNQTGLVSSTPTQGQTNVEPDSAIQLRFRNRYTASAITHNTTHGICTGSVRLSSDRFATCLGLTSQSRSNPELGLAPLTPLGVSRDYQLQVRLGSESVDLAFRTRGPSQTQRFLRGTVLDAKTGWPLSLVQVTTEPVTIPVVTDALGRFEISENLSANTNYVLRFRKSGFVTRVVAMRPVEYATYASVAMSEGDESTVDNSGGQIVTNPTPGSTDGTGSGDSTQPAPVLIPHPNVNPPSGSYTMYFKDGIHYAVAASTTSLSYRWNGNTGSWNTLLSTSPTTAGGNWQSVVICGNRLFLFGNGLSFHPDITQPNLPWLPVTPSGAPTYEWRGGTRLLCSPDNESVYIFGGGSNTYVLLYGARYSFATGLWSDPSSSVNAPNARYYPLIIPLPDRQQFFVWGGCSQISQYRNCNWTSLTQTGAIYDLKTHTWTHLPLTGAPRGRIATVFGRIGKHIIVWGGLGASGTSSISLNSGAVFDLDTQTWVRATSLSFAPTERYYNTESYYPQQAFGVVGESLMITGGTGSSTTAHTTDRDNFIYHYNPTTNQWTIQAK